MYARRWTLALAGLAMFGASACGLFTDEPLTDGDVCSVDDDCETGVCTTANLCSHSSCECPSGYCPEKGEQSPDCRDGWVCVRYDSLFDPLKEFFGGMRNPSDGYCQPSCDAGCPEHYVCDSEELCSPDATWVSPEPTITWSGAVAGELSGRDQTTTVMVAAGSTITLTGSAESPTGAAIVDFAWTTVSGSGDYMYFYEPTIQTMIPEVGDYRRVELDVTDDKARVGHISVVFEAI
jgi:hypothetical protein